MAAEAYGVALIASGDASAVDADATVRLRDAERERRRGFSATLPPGAGEADLPAVPGAPIVLSEALEIDANGRYRCRSCGQDLASNASNWKYFALASEAPVSPDAIRNRILERADASLVFRTYCCPGCATQLDTEVALAGEPPRWNYRGLD
jgi:N-methylhydantoinase B